MTTVTKPRADARSAAGHHKPRARPPVIPAGLARGILTHPCQAGHRPAHTRSAQRDPAFRAARLTHHSQDHPSDTDHRRSRIPVR